MKVSVDGKDCFELSETQKKVIKNDIHEDEFEEDMRRRLCYILKQKYEQCMNRLTNEWMPVLRKRYDSLPSDQDKLAELIFSQPDYQDRAKRDKSNVA